MDTKLLDILACPICKGLPVMLESEARTLTTDERLDK
jgi:uncharacterized protein YbaR (Trm112 family)